MKLMRRWIGMIFWLVVLASCLQADEKQADVKAALTAVKSIYALGEQNHWIEIKSTDSVQPIIDRLKGPAELEKCAILCMEIAFPMEAGDNGFDSYFYNGYHACVSKLAKIKGYEAGASLKTIEWRIQADGGEREMMDSDIEAQKRL